MNTDIPTMSSGQRAFTAAVLREGAAGLAAIACERLMAERPCAAARYGPAAERAWRGCMTAKLHALAAAIETGAPGVFARQMAWEKVAHASRAGDEGCADLRTALACLRAVIGEELPEGAAPAACAGVDAAIAALDAAPSACPPQLDVTTTHGRIAGEYLLAVLDGDRRRAVHIVLDAALREGPGGAPRVPIPELYARVLLPVQRELGRMWHVDELGVAEEHFATETTRTAIAALYLHLPRSEPTGKTAVCASVETDAHDLGVRMAADLLEMDGWRVIFLGASVPAEDLGAAVELFKADLVCLSASLPTHLPSLAESVRCVKGVAVEGGAPKVLVGGPALALEPDLWRAVGADAMCANLEEVSRTARALAGLPLLPTVAVG